MIYPDVDGSESDSILLSVGSGLQLEVGADMQLVSWVVGLDAGYTFHETERSRIAALAGIRYLSLAADLSLQVTGPLPPELPTEEYSQSGALWNGVVGIKGSYGKKWYLSYYLDVDQGDQEFISDMSLGGPAAGVSFRF